MADSELLSRFPRYVRHLEKGNPVFFKTTRFETLLEAVRDALVGMDQKGVIRFVNRQSELLFGYDRDDLIGEHIEKLVPEALWQIYASHRDDYFADPRTRSSGLDLELRGRHQNGREIPVNISLSHIDTGDVLLVITGASDVAKQKEAVRNAERITAIVEYSDDAIIATTSKGVITNWNPAAERMYGYLSREIIGRPIKLLIPEDRADEFSATLDRINRGENVGPRETVRVRKDGSVVPVSVTVAPLRDEEGSIVGASGVHRDVTEQRRAFEASQRLAAIVQSSDDAIIGKTLEGIITNWNPAAERMYGYSSQEVIGQPISLLMPKDRRDEMEEILGKIRADQHVEHFETLRVRKDGTVVPVSVTISPIHGTDGTVIGASAITRDVSQVRRAFEAAQRMAAIVESSDDAILGMTLKGIITSWNPGAERMYGYSSQEILGQPISLLMPKARHGEMKAILARIRAGEHVEQLETTRVRKDGTMFPVSITVSAIHGENGAVVGASGIGHDLTEQEHAALYARSLIEAGLDPLVTISPEGRIDDVNEATVTVTGVPRDQLLGTDFSSYFTDPDRAHEGYRRAFEKGSVTDYPLTLRHRDGTLTDVLYNASVYRDAAGNVQGVFAAARDMTTQKEAFEGAQRMAAIVEYSDDAIVGSTLDGIVTSWNPAAERMFGYSDDQIARRSVDLLNPQDRAGEIQAVLASIGRGKAVGSFETICTRKDRTTFPVKLTVAPVRNADGAVVGASTIARDVTEERQTLAAAKQMAAIVEFSGEAIIGCTLDGVITNWNPAAERMLGYTSEEIVGKSGRLMTPADRSGEINAVVTRLRAGQPVEHLETMRIRKDGTVFRVTLTVAPIHDADGAIIGLSMIARELAEQK